MKDKMSNDSLIRAISILIKNPALASVVLDHSTAPAKSGEIAVTRPLSAAKQLRNSRILMGHGMGLSNTEIQKLVGVSWSTIQIVIENAQQCAA